MTLGDKIRSMSDEELGQYIAREVLGLYGVRMAVSAEAWCWKFQQEAEHE